MMVDGKVRWSRLLDESGGSDEKDVKVEREARLVLSAAAWDVADSSVAKPVSTCADCSDVWEWVPLWVWL